MVLRFVELEAVLSTHLENQQQILNIVNRIKVEIFPIRSILLTPKYTERIGYKWLIQ